MRTGDAGTGGRRVHAGVNSDGNRYRAVRKSIDKKLHCFQP